MSKSWYAVYTKPQAEKKVVENLRKKGFDSFCLLRRQIVVNGLRRKTSFEPLLKSFVFVHAEEGKLSELLRISGINNVIYWLGQPAVIRDVEIHMMRQFVEDHQVLTLEQTEVNTKDIVRIMKSRRTDIGRNALTVERDVFKLVLPSLGYALVAEMDAAPATLVTGLEESLQNKVKQAYAVR